VSQNLIESSGGLIRIGRQPNGEPEAGLVHGDDRAVGGTQGSPDVLGDATREVVAVEHRGVGVVDEDHRHPRPVERRRDRGIVGAVPRLPVGFAGPARPAGVGPE
jgi:hypothetical protein